MKDLICTNCKKENGLNFKYCKHCGYQLPKIDTIQGVETPQELLKQKTKSSSFDKQKLLKTVVTVITFFITYYGVQYFFFNSDKLNSTIVEVSNELNKSLPLMLDQDTRLDNTIPLPNTTIQYNYTLVNYSIEDIDTNEFKSYLIANMVNLVVIATT